MDKPLSALARFLALLLALLLVLSLPLALFAFNLRQIIFNPEPVKRILTDELTNSDLAPVALEWFSDQRAQLRVERGEALTGDEEPDIVLLMSFLDREDWRQIKTEVLTDEMVSAWITSFVDAFFAWLESSDAAPQISLDMRSFRERVNSEHGIQAIQIAYGELEPCTVDQITDFEKRLEDAPANMQVLYNLCEFPDPWHEDQFKDYLATLSKTANQIPDDLDVIAELAHAGSDPTAALQSFRQIYHQLRTGLGYAWLVPLILLLLILALAVRSMRSLGSWWGIPLLIGGLLTIVLALLHPSLLSSPLVVGAISIIPELVRSDLQRLMLRLAGTVFQPVLIQGMVVALLGVILLAAGLLTKKKEPATEPPPQN
ncbi:MAG: hypothetical protein JXB15_03340 [Anaerolineales bacterium]|nr:hypothetical protein [Anaerolineales bacterium]